MLDIKYFNCCCFENRLEEARVGTKIAVRDVTQSVQLVDLTMLGCPPRAQEDYIFLALFLSAEVFVLTMNSRISVKETNITPRPSSTPLFIFPPFFL